MELYEQVGGIKYKRRSAACFFLPDDRGEPALEDLATRAGITRVSVEDPPGSGRMWSPLHWGGIAWIELCLERRLRHYLFEIQFSMYDFWGLLRERKDRRELPLEEEPYYPLVLAFRDACMALDPHLAIVTYHEYQDHRWVREEIEYRLRSYDPDLLAREPGLIYMDDPLYCGWRHRHDPAMPHDRVPTDRGILIFRGQGRDRWSGC